MRAEGITALIARLRAAGRDERLSTGQLYLDAADALERLARERDETRNLLGEAARALPTEGSGPVHERIHRLRLSLSEAVREAEAALAAAHDTIASLELEQASLREDVRRHAEALVAAQGEVTEAKTLLRQWVEAVIAHYPQNWAFDPTSPRGMVDNIVREAEARAALAEKGGA